MPPTSPDPALLFAALAGRMQPQADRLSGVRRLLEQGAPVNGQGWNDGEWNTPLRLAIAQKDLALVDTLLAAGADLEPSLAMPEDEDYDTGWGSFAPLNQAVDEVVYAVENLDDDLNDLDPDSPLGRSIAVMHRLIAAGADPTRMDPSGRSSALEVWAHETGQGLDQSDPPSPGLSRVLWEVTHALLGAARAPYVHHQAFLGDAGAKALAPYIGTLQRWRYLGEAFTRQWRGDQLQQALPEGLAEPRRGPRL